jgi:hypothetical protein
MKLLTKLPARLFAIFWHVYQMQGVSVSGYQLSAQSSLPWVEQNDYPDLASDEAR